MKTVILIAMATLFSACSLFGTRRAPEVVPSCFTESDNQEAYCKSQRTNEDGKVVTTRCIGSRNLEAKPNLRGKCVEKICSDGSNSDCSTRGDIAVLDQYTELATAKLFADEAPQPKKSNSTRERSRATVAAAPTPAPTPEPTPVAKKEIPREQESEQQSMSIQLKPVAKARSQASVKSNPNLGYKKLCVAKNEMNAPELIRGKCATRSCTAKKCIYKGRKEIFDWVAKANSSSGTE